MGNLIIKPSTGGELKLQDDGGTDAIAIDTSGGVSGTAVKDEDTMTSDSATHLATQQSIKAYVDSAASQATTAAQALGTGDSPTFAGATVDGNDLSTTGSPSFAGLSSTENIVMSAGKGIDFSATANSSGTMTSELLDDYEEGTWTPTSGIGTLSTANGKYTKIGNIVICTFQITFDSTTGSSQTIDSEPFVFISESGLTAGGGIATRSTAAIGTMTIRHEATGDGFRIFSGQNATAHNTEVSATTLASSSMEGVIIYRTTA